MVNWAQKAMYWLHVAAATALAAVLSMTVIDVLRRAIMGKALVGVVELTEFLMVGIVFLSIAYTQVQDQHIKVDFLVARLPSKTQVVIKIIMLAVGATFIGLVGWQGSWDALNAWQIQEYRYGPGGIHLYEWPARLAIPIGCFWLVLQLAIDIGRQVVRFPNSVKSLNEAKIE